jgi:voltage-gated potassium channel Kch
MRHFHLGQARAAILLVNDPDAARRALSAATSAFEALPVLMRTRRAEDRRALQELGAVHVVVEELEGGVEMAANVLALIGTPFESIRQSVDEALTEDGQVSTQQWLSVPLDDPDSASR